VAVGIVLLLAGGLFAVFLPSSGGFRLQPAAVDVQQRLRVAAGVLRDSMLDAGSGPVNPLFGLPLGATVPCLLPYRIGARAADAAGTCRLDLVTSLAAVAASAAPRLAADFQGAAGEIRVVPGAGCPVGDAACGIEARESVLLVDPSGQWDLFGVAGVVGDLVTLEARGPSSRRRFAAGAWVVRVVVSVCYLRAASAADAPLLAHYDGHASDLPQVDHVVVLGFEWFGEPRAPRMRAPPGPLGELMTYGPPPPDLDADDGRDSWGPGENCVIRVDGGTQVPRLSDLGTDSRLVALDPAILTDGPWCPDDSAATRFDADLLRIRKTRVTLRVEALSESLRGADTRFFHRPGASTGGPRLVQDRWLTFDVVPRSIGGGL
jgi:hypothetical protein